MALEEFVKPDATPSTSESKTSLNMPGADPEICVRYTEFWFVKASPLALAQFVIEQRSQSASRVHSFVLFVSLIIPSGFTTSTLPESRSAPVNKSVYVVRRR